MGVTHYLAMTGAEFSSGLPLPQSLAWMACHFSPYGLGLSNLPASLPPGSLLILDDITPIGKHDPQVIRQQLEECMASLSCSGLLLDLQRPGQEGSAALAAHLAEALPFPVGVSEAYAGGLACPVFLPPPPCSLPLGDYLAPWEGREVWLETALSRETITLTEAGAHCVPFSMAVLPPEGFSDSRLCCHYHIQIQENALTFSLWRSHEDLADLLTEAEAMGVARAIGLYQELGAFDQ